jgi:hypothetical protein
LRFPLLNIGVTNESIQLTGKTQDASDLLKSRQSGNANAEAQFFRINGETPSGPGPLLLAKSNNAFNTSKTVNWSDLKGGSLTSSGPGSDGTHGLFAYVRSINLANRSQIFCDPDHDWPSKLFLESGGASELHLVNYLSKTPLKSSKILCCEKIKPQKK